MNKFNDFLESVFSFLASLKLAVMIIISIAILAAIGTFLEARYDAAYAQKVIYLSPYMFFVLSMLCVNLINVMARCAGSRVLAGPWMRTAFAFTARGLCR